MEQQQQSCQVHSVYSEVIHAGIPTEWELIKQNQGNCDIFWEYEAQQGKQEAEIVTEDMASGQITLKKPQGEGKNEKMGQKQYFYFDIEPIPENNQKKIEILEDDHQKIKTKSQQITKNNDTKKKKSYTKKKAIKKKTNKLKASETKNITKNYGKQIMKNIKVSRDKTERVLKTFDSKYSYDQLIAELKKIKKKFYRIQDLRSLWLEKQFSKEVRILSMVFLRRHCLNWVFNSRIQNYQNPLKYRYNLMKGVQNPNQFTSFK